ncbi:MAG: hypothetical protein K2P57_02750 [Burkholderiales bacterium]|nr:hypothetical protein [Burkholderiales bacterium]
MDMNTLVDTESARLLNAPESVLIRWIFFLFLAELPTETVNKVSDFEMTATRPLIAPNN